MFRVTPKMKPADNCPSELKRLAGVSTMALVLAMGGCASYQKDHFKVGSVPEDYRTKHPIVVSQDEVKEDLIVTANMKGMSFRHENVVNDFLSRFRRSGAKSLRIILPAGSHNEGAARRVAHDIISHMKKERIHRDQIVVARYHAANHGDAATIRLSYNSIGAHVASNCGEWTDDLVETSENRNYNNFGCATQNNLAEMIANPEDLISPRGQSEIDAERRDNVINDWRDNGTDALPQLL